MTPDSANIPITRTGTSIWVDALLASLLVVATVLYAGHVAYVSPGQGLDQDGWGHRVGELKAASGRPDVLLRHPSLWKGPVVPFVFGVTYLAWPDDKSILYLNAVLWGLTQAVLYFTFRFLGASRLAVCLALLAWVGYYSRLPIMFQYYFAEPWVALLSAALLAMTATTLRTQRLALAAAAGVAASVLLLSRAPFALVTAAIPVLFWLHGGPRRLQLAGVYLAFAAAALAPWPLRNYLAEGALIPFTTEGGKIVAQGTFLPGDDENFNALRQMPRWQALEAGEKDLSQAGQYQYWKAIAKEQILADPVSQALLIPRKAMRFWVYLDHGRWVPTLKTGVIAGLSLALAAIGLYAHRRDLLAQLCAVWIGGLWAFHALIHCELRYNFPVAPMLFLLAALGAQYLVSCVPMICRRQFAAAPSRNLDESGALV